MRFPLDLRFKVLAIASQISVIDASGRLLYYVRQKAFKLKEAVTVFADAEQSRPVYRIAADRVLDISARYHIEDQSGAALGVVQRHGLRSLWRAHYEIQRNGRPLLDIREERPWVRIVDGVVSLIPFVELLTGYFLHPAYRVSRSDTGAAVLRLVKQPALFEGVYRLDQIGDLSEDEERLAVLGIVVLVLLERSRG